MEKTAQASRHSRGFTLLEMMLSIAVFTLLMVAAFSVVGASTELITEVSEVQNDSALRLRFIEACRAAFESMTDKSSVEFHYIDNGSGQFNTYLSLVDTPDAFDFGMNRFDEINRVVIAAEIQRDGFIRSGVYYMTEAAFEEARQNNFSRIEAPYVELVPRMRQLTWRFYDSQARTWRQTLDGNFSTSLIELTARVHGDSAPFRSVFWYLNRS